MKLGIAALCSARLVAPHGGHEGGLSDKLTRRPGDVLGTDYGHASTSPAGITGYRPRAAGSHENLSFVEVRRYLQRPRGGSGSSECRTRVCQSTPRAVTELDLQSCLHNTALPSLPS